MQAAGCVPKASNAKIHLLEKVLENRYLKVRVPSPGKINRIPTFLLQNPAARAGPRLSYTKPETVRRDGSNEVTWAFNESLLALLFTHHRFLLNRSIAAGRARARPIRKFALLDRVDFMVVGKVLGGKPAQGFVCLLL